VVLGGKAVEGKGYFYPPTLLLDVRQEMSIMHEETFGPVLPVVAFDTLEEALAMANDSDYGLTSSVYTQNLNTAMKAIKGLKFGETYINRENFEAMQGFHAGWRKSGIGGADGRHGLKNICKLRWSICRHNGISPVALRTGATQGYATTPHTFREWRDRVARIRRFTAASGTSHNSHLRFNPVHHQIRPYRGR
jgi:delta 1-pyrroline-5-carboxylate dehydrogenase